MIFILIFTIILILSYFVYNFKNQKELFTNNYKPSNWNKLKFIDKINIYRKNIGKKESIYADKLKVKKIVMNKNIENLFVPKTIKILDKNTSNLNIKSLPKNCIIKSAHGWNDLIIIKNSKIDKMIARGKKLENKPENYNIWRERSLKIHDTRENHYKFIEPNFFVEEYLGDEISDYKFYCFYGECKFFQIINERFKHMCMNFYDKKLNILPINRQGKNNCNEDFKLPDNINLMIKIAEILSKDFEFIRIDLYNIKNKIYFSEYTFVPNSGYLSFYPEKYEYEIGKYWR